MTEDLLEDVRTVIGCEFITDLRYEPFNDRARKLMAVIDLELYPFPDVLDAVSYLFFSERHFEGIQQVKEFIRQDSCWCSNSQQKDREKIAAGAKVCELSKV